MIDYDEDQPTSPAPSNEHVAAVPPRCGSCIALQAEIDCCAEAIGPQLLMECDGHVYEAVHRLRAKLDRATALGGKLAALAVGSKGPLFAPCLFCGYCGAGYWQAGTHDASCPWHGVGGLQGREERLAGAFRAALDESTKGGDRAD